MTEKPTKTTKKPSNSLDFEERIVAFIDILGFSNTVNNENNVNECIQAIQALKRISKSDKKRGAPSFVALDGQIAQFSDCIIISYSKTPKKSSKYSDDPLYYALWRLAMDISLISRRMAEEGFVIRGGIAIGNLLHKRNFIVGKSLVNAYELERDTAIHPRVVISKDLIQQLKKEATSLKYLKKISCIRLDDFDKNYVIDLIGYTQYKHGQKKRYKDYINNLNKIIHKFLKSPKTPNKVKEKYHYLNNLLEQLDDYGDDED